MRKIEKQKQTKALNLQVEHSAKMIQKEFAPKPSPEPTVSLYGNRHNRRRVRALAKAHKRFIIRKNLQKKMERRKK